MIESENDVLKNFIFSLTRHTRENNRKIKKISFLNLLFLIFSYNLSNQIDQKTSS